MKKSLGLFITAVAAMLFALGITSCDKDLINVDVPMEFSEATFIVPASILAGDFKDSTTVSANLDSILTSRKIDKKNIKSIKIEFIELSVLNGDTSNNFRLVENLEASMQKGAETPTKVGSVTNNPDKVAMKLNLTTDSDKEFKSLLDGNSFTFRVSGKTRRAVTEEMTVKAKMKFKISAGL